jgi:hypothetical protein
MAQQSTTAERRDALKKPRTGRQMDDNIDDLGRRPDGSRQEQPESEQAKRVREGAAERERGEGKAGHAEPKHR